MPRYQLALLLAIPLVATAVLRSNAYALTLLAFILIYGVLAMGTCLTMGRAGQITLAQAGFFAVGAYAASYTTQTLHLPFAAALVVALVISVIAGFGLGYPVLRVKGHFLGLITLAFAQVVHEVAMDWESVTGGANGLYGMVKPSLPGMDPLVGFVVLLIGFWFVVLVGADNLINSRYGRAMHMLKASEWGAQACGINVARYKSEAFALSAGICGGAGAFYAHFIGYIGPESFTLDVSITVVAMCILGGMTDLRGVLLGSVIMTLLNEPLRNYPLYQPVMYGAVMLAVIILLPRGIVPSISEWLATRRKLKQMPAAALRSPS